MAYRGQVKKGLNLLFIWFWYFYDDKTRQVKNKCVTDKRQGVLRRQVSKDTRISISILFICGITLHILLLWLLSLIMNHLSAVKSRSEKLVFS